MGLFVWGGGNKLVSGEMSGLEAGWCTSSMETMSELTLRAFDIFKYVCPFLPKHERISCPGMCSILQEQTLLFLWTGTQQAAKSFTFLCQDWTCPSADHQRIKDTHIKSLSYDQGVPLCFLLTVLQHYLLNNIYVGRYCANNLFLFILANFVAIDLKKCGQKWKSTPTLDTSLLVEILFWWVALSRKFPV